LIAGHADQPVTEPGQQRGMIRPRLPADAPGLGVRVARAEAEETQVEVVGRHGGVHGTDGLGVGRACRPDEHRAPVGQQRVPPGPRGRPGMAGATVRCGHAASPEAASPELVVTGSPAGMMRAYWSGNTMAMWPPLCHLMM